MAGGITVVWMFISSRHAAATLIAERSPAASLRIKALPPQEVQMLLQYQASELARTLLEQWGFAEIILGCGFFFFLLFGTGEGKTALIVAVALLVMSLGQVFLLSPALISYGRLADFIPRTTASFDRDRMRVLQVLLAALEGCKLAVGLVLAGILMRHKRRLSGDSWDQLNRIDKPDHRHVNR